MHLTLSIRKLKKYLVLNYSHSRSLSWKEILYNSELFEKNVGMECYKRPFISCKPNEEWPHINLDCYNENGIKVFIWNSKLWID